MKAGVAGAVTAAVCLMAPAVSAATVTANGPNPLDAWNAMSEIEIASVGETATYAVKAGTSAAISDAPFAGFPRQGSTFQIFSTGNATLADQANSATALGTVNGGTSANPSLASDPSQQAVVSDMLHLRVAFDVPDDADCLSLDFKYLTDETDPASATTQQDGFFVKLDNPSAPPPLGVMLPSNAPSLSSANAAGTTYYAATARLRALAPVEPGTTEPLNIYVWDSNDAEVDTAAFIDRFTLDRNPHCASRADFLPVPTTEITAGPPKKTSKRAAKFEFKSPSDPESTFECSLDGAEFEACESPVKTGKLKKAKHTFEVRAILDGREDLSPAKASWKIK